jgi:DNA-binding transcriptional MerR regulator
LFDAAALWVGVVGTLQALGLTLGEIQELAGSYLGRPGENIGPRLAGMLGMVRARTKERIAELHQLLQRIDEFEAGAGRQNWLAEPTSALRIPASGKSGLTPSLPPPGGEERP